MDTIFSAPFLFFALIVGLVIVVLLYRFYSKKHSHLLNNNNLSINVSNGQEGDQKSLPELPDLSAVTHDQKQASQIIEQAVTKARQTLLDTEYFKKSLADQMEKSLLEVEENTSRLLEGESEALDQQYKDLLAHMQQAIVKARETLVNTEYLREDFIKELEGNLNKVGTELQETIRRQSADLSKQYEDLFVKVREAYLKQSEHSTKEFEQVAEKRLDEFQKMLADKTINSEGVINQSFQARYAQVEQEIQQYRAQKLASVDAMVTKVLEAVTVSVLGRALSVSDHEELVMQAINEAKQKGVLS